MTSRKHSVIFKIHFAEHDKHFLPIFTKLALSMSTQYNKLISVCYACYTCINDINVKKLICKQQFDVFLLIIYTIKMLCLPYIKLKSTKPVKEFQRREIKPGTGSFLAVARFKMCDNNIILH